MLHVTPKIWPYPPPWWLMCGGFTFCAGSDSRFKQVWPTFQWPGRVRRQKYSNWLLIHCLAHAHSYPVAKLDLKNEVVTSNPFCRFLQRFQGLRSTWTLHRKHKKKFRSLSNSPRPGVSWKCSREWGRWSHFACFPHNLFVWINKKRWSKVSINIQGDD